ncbi:putative inorganic phosphate cotransporter [Episyrphus balteatus]|uniref:putative inorganic phosphate cotransporter n=1 Tax=Episyrphus balteatus TaxID=286459 RepID=UPI002485A624|nr:putative inorganic phosphate cotransporter [Episyrphus balteatus]
MAATAVIKGPVIGIRHLQTLLLFFSILVNYAGRLNISVSLVAMTNADTTNPDFHEFDWDEKQRSYVISSFYWGYFITQFPGGYMARKFGVKATILMATLGSSLLNIIVPLCVYWGGWQIYCGIRILQGLFQGMVFPCVHEHLAKWSPIDERTRLGGLSHTGIECGTIVAMGLSGIIAGSSLGWPGISYVFGGIGIVFCVLWMIFADNTPSEARFITDEEKIYILTSQESAGGNDSERKIPIPWKAIFTSIPFLSLLSVRILQGWGFTTMQAQIPAYLHGVLKMDIKSNALYSTLPYLTMWILSNVYLIAADIILKNKWASLNVTRKTMNTIALWIPAALLIGIGFLDENQKALAVTFMTLNVGLNGGQTIGSSLNTIDLSPNHAGILMGIVNSIANIVPILTPIAVGIIVYDETQRTQWQIVFAIAAVLFFLGNLQFLIFGTTDTQPWNDENFIKAESGLNGRKTSETHERNLSKANLEVY